MEVMPLPPGVVIDPDQPSPARIYDRFLGGTHNFPCDRAVADRATDLMPMIPAIARANRQFLRRAVTAVAELGVDQFLDLGSGIPTEGNVHEVAREVNPDARVVYVDIDPVAVEHSRAILGDDPRSLVLRADLLDTRRILGDRGVRQLLDFARPVCVLLVACGHFILDTLRLSRAIVGYRTAVPSGSYLAMSHVTSEARPAKQKELLALFANSGTPVIDRDRVQLSGLLHGWEPIPPGLVFTPEWRPDTSVDAPSDYHTLAVAARKP
jgi:hypothetical protein